MAIDKSTWNKKIKVSQSTINDIKKLGMTKALKLAQTNSKATQAGLVAEYQEATRRLYGDRRFGAATKAKAPVAKSPDAARAGATKPAPRPTNKPMAKPAPKPAAKKNNNNSNIIKGTLGTAAAVGALALSKGKAAGLASKLSPSVGKFASSGVGKAIFGTGEKLTTKGMVTSGKFAAKARKQVSQSQYDAMVEAAKAKGIKLPAAKAAAKKTVKKAAATTKPRAKVKTVKAGIAASGAGQTKK